MPRGRLANQLTHPVGGLGEFLRPFQRIHLDQTEQLPHGHPYEHLLQLPRSAEMAEDLRASLIGTKPIRRDGGGEFRWTPIWAEINEARSLSRRDQDIMLVKIAVNYLLLRSQPRDRSAQVGEHAKRAINLFGQ